MRILISGAGIAGPTLAYWLARFGFTPTIVESAPALRSDGYIIDFWGTGFEIADRMGLLPAVRANGYMVREVRVVNDAGARIAGFSAAIFDKITRGRYVTISRGELAAELFKKLAGRVETIFGDAIARIDQSYRSVRVLFASGVSRDFDLVIGADGLHSCVRKLTFGPSSQFEKYLGYKAAAFEIQGYRPRDENVYVMHTEVGQQIVRYALRDDRTTFLFTFTDNDPSCPADLAAQKDVLRRRFARSGWESRRILDALDSVDRLYFDRVSQIRMEPRKGLWTRGRVTLVGDAASSVSVLAGQGSSLAMTAAYILAGELHRADGDHQKAFARYQSLFGPFVAKKQKAAVRFASVFGPKSPFALDLRNRIFNLLAVQPLADFIIGRDLAARVALPDYAESRRASALFRPERVG